MNFNFSLGDAANGNAASSNNNNAINSTSSTNALTTNTTIPLGQAITTTTHRRAGRRADPTANVDDIFAQICSRMSSLTTDNKPEMISAFMSVLMCSESEAKFFLESANWDVQNVSIMSWCSLHYIFIYFFIII